MQRNVDGKLAFTYRRALEALRSGVPNREAVNILGCNQPEAEHLFATLLQQCADQQNPPGRSLGMLVAGGFGSGKSHLLSYLEHHALSQGFVCSRVAISKETPLYDLGKVFKSAVDQGCVPDRSGQLMEAIGVGLHENSGAYGRVLKWADSERHGLHRMFPATAVVHGEASDPELMSDIRAFWSGERIAVSRVKNGLRAIGQLQNYIFRAPKASELAPQRLRFATELIKGAGYQGWVVLLDEIELVGYYSRLQRARSYAELARWLGKVSGDACPGLVVVGTVTDDFASRIISPDDPAGKKDRDYVGHWLHSRGEAAVAARAETGMRVLEQEAIQLQPPTAEQITTTVEKLRRIYSVAYTWEAPRAENPTGGAGHRSRMRYKVRAAINKWDLMRLYPNSRPEMEGIEYRPDYQEDPELTRAAENETDGTR